MNRTETIVNIFYKTSLSEKEVRIHYKYNFFSWQKNAPSWEKKCFQLEKKFFPTGNPYLGGYSDFTDFSLNYSQNLPFKRSENKVNKFYNIY